MNFSGTCANCQQEKQVKQFPGGLLCQVCFDEFMDQLTEGVEIKESEPTYLVRSIVSNIGTQEQIDQISEKQTMPSKKATATEKEIRWANHINRKQPSNVDNRIDRMMGFIKAKIKNSKSQRPTELTYDFVKALYWRTYRTIVKEETGLELKSEAIRKDQYLSEAMKNICHWMIMDAQSKWPPNSSLYLWGERGIGKSTLASAAYRVMESIYREFAWEPCNFGFASMDQVFMEVYTTANLEEINKMGKGNFIIDELKEDHVKYKHFGNDLPILEIILLSRHELWKRGSRSIITTNIAPNKLNSYFQNERLRDRMRQEYHTIEIKGENKRNPKFRL